MNRTIFLKSIKAPTDTSRLLKPASMNAKLGKGDKWITKGKWKGMPMYSLTLEERKTCPTSCEQWKNCYGNNMPFAHRIDHTSTRFLSSLTAELETLSSSHPTGFVVRLHVLGDFYSVEYVRYWESALRKYPALRIFGYTHRKWKAIRSLNAAGAWIRFSDAGGPMSANVMGEGITCPEQTGKTKSCLTCGLCWSTTKAINFLEH